MDRRKLLLTALVIVSVQASYHHDHKYFVHNNYINIESILFFLFYREIHFSFTLRGYQIIVYGATL